MDRSTVRHDANFVVATDGDGGAPASAQRFVLQSMRGRRGRAGLGGASGMGEDVDAVLRTILGSDVVDDMAAAGRYRRDVY
ncbi:MAG: hypothetical protein ABI277_00895 [Burkholderiaceae bacterium]